MKTTEKLTILSLIIILISANLNAQTYSIVYGNNEFAFDFYKECGNGGSENVFISPFSISSALAMTYPGARGKTAEEMKQAMGFLDDLKTQNSEYASLTSALTKSGSSFYNYQYFVDSSGYELRI